MTIDPKIMTIDPNICATIKKTNLKITDPKGIFGEKRDYKTVIRDSFTVPLNLPVLDCGPQPARFIPWQNKQSLYIVNINIMLKDTHMFVCKNKKFLICL